MNLKKKKLLTARAFGISPNRVEFVKSRLEEIKEAITKQDIRDLQKNGAIKVKPIKGRKTKRITKRKKGIGSVRKKVNKRKEKYVILTRKLRKHFYETRSKLTDKEKKDIKNKIRNSFFKSKSHLKTYIDGAKK